MLQRGLQPPPDIQHHPRLVGVRRHRLDQQLPGHAVEEPLDIQVDHPVLRPAAPSAHRDRVQRRPARPVAVGVGMEARLHRLLQPPRHHGLGDPVRDRGHPKHPGPAAMRLGYLHRQHRRRQVAARRHPVPDLVQVAPEILLEVLQRAPVHTRCALVGLHLPIGLPHLPLGDHNRLSWWPQRVHQAPPEPAPGCPNEPATDDPAPSLPALPRQAGASLLLPAGPPAHPHRYSAPCGFRPLGTLPRTAHGRSCRGAPSHVPCRSSRPGSRRLHAGHRLAKKRAPARLLPGRWSPSRF